MNRLLDFAFVGSSMVFGPLGSKEVWPRIMNQVLGPEGAQWSVVFAFQVLPTIIFIAALFAILYYFGVMQLVVQVFAVVMRRVMRASRGRIAERGGEHLHGADRGAADDQALPATHDRIRVDDGHDVGHGAHLRRHHGGLHPLRHRSAAPADGGDHDRARNADDGQDLRPGDGSAGDDGDGEARDRADRRERDRRRRPRHQRGPGAGAQRRRDADLVPRPDRAGQRAPRASPG